MPLIRLNQRGSVMIVALISTFLVVSVGAYINSQSEQLTKAMQVPKLTADRNDAQNQVLNMLLQPTTYTGCNSSGGGSNDCALDDTAIDNALPQNFAIVGRNFNSLTRVFTGTLTYTGNIATIAPIALNFTVPEDAMQGGVIACTNPALPRLIGITAGGTPNCVAADGATSGPACGPGQYITAINSDMTVVCASIGSEPLTCPVGKYISDVHWLTTPDSDGNRYTITCADRKDPFTFFDFTPSVASGFLATVPPACPVVNYTLTCNTNDCGASASCALSPTGGSYAAGTDVNLTATVDFGYVVTGWSGGTFSDASTATTNTVDMSGNKVVTINCDAPASDCPAQTIGNCELGLTASGNTVNGTCSLGYSGACNYTCTAGAWSMNSNTCSVPSGGPCNWVMTSSNGGSESDGLAICTTSPASTWPTNPCSVPNDPGSPPDSTCVIDGDTAQYAFAPGLATSNFRIDNVYECQCASASHTLTINGLGSCGGGASATPGTSTLIADGTPTNINVTPGSGFTVTSVSGGPWNANNQTQNMPASDTTVTVACSAAPACSWVHGTIPAATPQPLSCVVLASANGGSLTSTAPVTALCANISIAMPGNQGAGYIIGPGGNYCGYKPLGGSGVCYTAMSGTTGAPTATCDIDQVGLVRTVFSSSTWDGPPEHTDIWTCSCI